MASRFYNCICGRFAGINMLAWITGDQKIECNCGRQLNVNDSFFGFNLDTAHYAWQEFMRKEYFKQQRNKKSEAINVFS